MALINCPECGKEISDQAISCPNCGTPIKKGELKFCQHCGEKIDKECVVCPKCGKQVSDFPTGQGSSPIVINNSNSASSAASSSVSVSQTIIRSGRQVKKVVYCVLALLLGGIGIHKFYAGKTLAGIVYILFCWTGIPSFIAVIEFVIALCKSSDEYGYIWV